MAASSALAIPSNPSFGRPAGIGPAVSGRNQKGGTAAEDGGPSPPCSRRAAQMLHPPRRRPGGMADVTAPRFQVREICDAAIALSHIYLPSAPTREVSRIKLSLYRFWSQALSRRTSSCGSDRRVYLAKQRADNLDLPPSSSGGVRLFLARRMPAVARAANASLANDAIAVLRRPPPPRVSGGVLSQSHRPSPAPYPLQENHMLATYNRSASRRFQPVQHPSPSSGRLLTYGGNPHSHGPRPPH